MRTMLAESFCGRPALFATRSLPFPLTRILRNWSAWRVLYNFAGIPDGVYPTSNLVADTSGHLYGTTVLGGTGTCIQSFHGPSVGCGTVFE